MRKIAETLCKSSNFLSRGLDSLSSIFALGVRLSLFRVFFWSGWLKATDWTSTLALFENEFTIVGMPPVVAAYLGTAAELILPVLLLLGIGGRIPALLFFIVNIYMVVSYPILLTPEYICALKDHYIDGILIAILLFYGVGKISVDYLLQKKVCRNYRY